MGLQGLMFELARSWYGPHLAGELLCGNSWVLRASEKLVAYKRCFLLLPCHAFCIVDDETCNHQSKASQ